MTGNTDGKQLEDGTIEDANLDSSNSDNGQQSSPEAIDTAKQLKTLQSQVDALTRALQSDKDKAVAKTNQRLNVLEQNIKEVLQSAAQRNLSVQDVLGEIKASEQEARDQALLELAQAYKSGTFPGVTPQGSGQQSGVDVTNVLRELELDESDTRVQAFRAQSFKSEAEAYRAAALLLKNSKQPTEASRPSPVGKAPVSASQQEKLQSEYEAGSKNLRGQALINFKMEMRKKGLNVY